MNNANLNAPILLALLLLSTACASASTLSNRWLFLSANLQPRDSINRIEPLLNRAAAVGYNGVYLTDYKTGFFWDLEYPRLWRTNAARLRQLTRTHGMSLAVGVFPFGNAGSLLWHNPNLASGMPLRDVPLIAKEDHLVPVATAAIPSGTFTDSSNHRVTGCLFQDAPGRTSFIDRHQIHRGNPSLRFEGFTAEPKGLGRIAYRTAVRPWQQYRIRVWMKAEQLTAGLVQIAVRGQDQRWLQHQALFAKHGNSKQLRPLESANQLTCDWTEQLVTFNSLQNTDVVIYLGAWNASAGRVWWNNLRIESTPTLNLLRRDSLPLTLRDATGGKFKEGIDYEPVADPKLGHITFPGTFDTRHEPPAIRLTRNSRIRAGQTVYLSAHHTAISNTEKLNMSLDHPAVWSLCEQQLTNVLHALQPDALFMMHDEIRVGGWEPDHANRFSNSGELLAHNVRRCTEIIRRHTDKPAFIWSDMFDPHHNAHDNYYLIKSDLAGSWNGLSPEVTIMKWGSGPRARPGLRHFAQRGHAQMIAAYYDRDPERDHAEWTASARGIRNIIGVMYTTWRNNYADLEQFARIWWGGTHPPNPTE